MWRVQYAVKPEKVINFCDPKFYVALFSMNHLRFCKLTTAVVILDFRGVIEFFSNKALL